MYGNQGTNPPGTGFTLGTGSGGTGPASGGFSLGGNKSGASGAFSGFNFGGTGTSTTQAASGTQVSSAPGAGFNFGAQAASKSGFGGFNFGGTPQTSGGQAQPTAAAAPTLGGGGTGAGGGGGGGFGFGTPTAGTQPQSTGFSLGGQTNNNSTAGNQLTATMGAVGGAVGGAGLSGGIFKATGVPSATTSSGFAGFATPSSTSGPPASTTVLGGLLGRSSTAPATTPAQAPAVSSTATGSGFNFGAAPSATTSTAAAPASSTSTGFNFGTATSQATSSAAPSLGSGLSLPSFGTSASTASSVPSLTSGTLATSTASAPSLGATGGSQKQMTFRQLEETINKWTTELEDQEKYFLDQATQVNAWDRIVMENGEKIIQLNKDVEKVKLDQQKLDHELDFVHSQQKELEDILTPLEKALDSMPPISYQQHADVEREHTYMLAESLDAQLKRMGQDLKEIIERFNSTNTKPDASDPMQQITKILNAHVVSLMWVERNSANLGRRVEEISKQMDLEKREQERNFRLAYS